MRSPGNTPLFMHENVPASINAPTRIRIGHPKKDLLHILEKITEAGAGFRSLTEHINTTTPAGRMMLQMLGSFAEFERSMVRGRTRLGLQAARERGRVGGRQPKLTAH
jgi:DNA invertase Pin-like site-specific DNA recombinase